jgi:hypothetical protein
VQAVFARSMERRSLAETQRGQPQGKDVDKWRQPLPRIRQGDGRPVDQGLTLRTVGCRKRILTEAANVDRIALAQTQAGRHALAVWVQLPICAMADQAVLIREIA